MSFMEYVININNMPIKKLQYISIPILAVIQQGSDYIISNVVHDPVFSANFMVKLVSE